MSEISSEIQKQKNRSLVLEEERSVSSPESVNQSRNEDFPRGLLPGVTSTPRSSPDHPHPVPSPDRRSSPLPVGGSSVSRNNNSQTEARKWIKAEVMEKDNEVILILHGLPRDIDWDNSKVVDSLDEEDEDEVDDSNNPLKKLKLATQDKNFRKDGFYREKFRTL